MSYLRKPKGQKRGTPKPCGLKKSLEPAKPMMPSSPLTESIIMPIGEDDGAMKRHYVRMEKEMKRMNPNPKIVSELFKRTFPARRAEILKGQTCLRAILEKYPLLSNPNEVNIWLCMLVVIFIKFLRCLKNLTEFKIKI